MSPTVRRSSPKPSESAVSTTMHTSGDGTALVSRGKQVDDGEARGDHRVGEPRHADQLRQLRHEDQDRQRVDEAGDHRARDEAHQVAEPQEAGRRSAAGR